MSPAPSATAVIGREIVDGLLLWPVDAPDQHQVAVVTYCPDQPHELRLTLLTTRLTAVGRVFLARELLRGLLANEAPGPGRLVGCDRVQIGPAPTADRVLLRLWIGAEWADFHAERSRLQDILAATLKVVPAGDEHRLVDVDGAFAAMLPEVTP
uniref:SsgA family sporulation/cell division regulator n=1 Tax=Streptosporangium sp. CA-256172 TaxID=3240076 RepID=UPI003F49751F